MGRKQYSRNAEREPPTTGTLRAVGHLNELLLAGLILEAVREFDRLFRDDVLKRMYAVAHHRLTMIQLADVYHNGLAVVIAKLEKDYTTLELDTADQWLAWSYMIFRSATLKYTRYWHHRSKRMKQHQPHPEADEDTWVDARSDDRTADQQEAAELVARAIDGAGLTGQEALVLTTYLAHADSFNRRDKFAPLAKLINSTYNHKLTSKEVRRIWRRGLKKVRRYLTKPRPAARSGETGVPPNATIERGQREGTAAPA